MKKEIFNYNDLLNKLKNLSNEQLTQEVKFVSDDLVLEPYYVKITQEDYLDCDERDYGEPLVLDSELSGTETEVHVAVKKGTVLIICDV